MGTLMWQHVAIVTAVLSQLVFAATEAKPLSIRASQQWDGKEGPWSTFRIQVGSPAQQIRVLPAHDQSSTWVVLGEACRGNANVQDCTKDRGRLFTYNDSSTWQETGFYDLEPWLEMRVGQDGPGYFGWDDITLGWEGDNLPTVKNQSVVGITTSNFWLGSLSLNPRPVNFTTYNDPEASLMQVLRNKTDEPIPSLSWSYTAGAYNLAPPVFGSLVLGGYDTTRFEPNSVTFPFGRDISFDFQVAIQDITTSMVEGSLLDTGIIAYVSTLVADIWLPESACKEFETAFGLTWDEKTELYLLNSTLHQKLLKKNPDVTFSIGPDVSGAAVTINMPYWNFYLTATPELTGASSDKLYFPLKRAANDTQYVLGRAFLQSAHLSADYERKTFNLSQAMYPSSSTSENVVAVLPPLEETSSGAGGPTNSGGGNNSDSSSSDSSLSTGAIVGIAVGLAVVAAVVGAVIFIMCRRRKVAKPKKHELEDTDVMHQPLPHEVSGEQSKLEMGGELSHEVAGDMDPKAELAAYGHQKPVEAEGNSEQIYEMQGNDVRLAEMPGDFNLHHKVPLSYSTSQRPAVVVTNDDDTPAPSLGNDFPKGYHGHV